LQRQNYLDDLSKFIGDNKLLVIDEAQRIPNIGLNLKIIVDNIPGIHVVATGSSSFELTGQTGEPLTGRKKTLILYPVSMLELKKNTSSFDLKRFLPERLVFGSYPQIITSKFQEEKSAILNELINSYLLKDILELEKVKGSKILLDLLRMIAFQVGSEVSLTELGREIGIDTKTVARYLDLFEKSFILYNLRGFSRNLRSEINRKSKYYFYDNGVRNAVISNFNPVEKRNDTGALWENFMVAERLKKQSYGQIFANNYFWRTWEQKEIDWVEEREGRLIASEFKWNQRKNHKVPALFRTTYPESTVNIITPENFTDFVT